jgi:hypothetical protein
LDRFVLGEIRPTDLRDRLHHQHPRPGPRIPHGSHYGPAVPGVPIGCRSPRKRGPYSTPLHTVGLIDSGACGNRRRGTWTSPTALDDLHPELHRLPLGIPAGVLEARRFQEQCPSRYPGRGRD